MLFVDLQVEVEGTSRTVRWPDHRLGNAQYFEPSESGMSCSELIAERLSHGGKEEEQKRR